MSPKTHPGAVEKIDLFLLLLVVLFLYFLLFKLPFHPFFLESDQLVFLYNADRMMQGEHMYSDFFQFTFPGGQVLYYLLFLIFGTKFWVLGFATILVGATSFWVCLRVSKQLIRGPLAYLPALLFAFFGLRWFGLDGSHRMFSPLFVLCAVWILLKGRSYLHLAVAGLFCALASYFTQQRGVVAVAALILFIFVDNYSLGWQLKRFFKETLVILMSFAITLLVICSYFIATAGFSTFIWSTLIYPATYYHFHEQNNPGVFFINLGKAFADTGAGIGPLFIIVPILFYSFLPLSIIAFFIVFWRNRRKHDWEFWRGPVLVAVVGAFLVLSTTAPSYSRLFHISAPPLILLFWMLGYFALFRNSQRSLATVVAAGLIVFSMLQAYRIQTHWDYLEIDGPRGKVYAPRDEPTERYLWLKDHTKPGDYVFEVYEPFVYFPLGLHNPSRFTQIVPTEYTRPEFVSGTIEDLQKNKTKYILWDNTYNKPEEERALGDHTGPLADFVQMQYSPIGKIYKIDGHPIQIWEIKAK